MRMASMADAQSEAKRSDTSMGFEIYDFYRKFPTHLDGFSMEIHKTRQLESESFYKKPQIS